MPFLFWVLGFVTLGACSDPPPAQEEVSTASTPPATAENTVSKNPTSGPLILDERGSWSVDGERLEAIQQDLNLTAAEGKAAILALQGLSFHFDGKTFTMVSAREQVSQPYRRLEGQGPILTLEFMGQNGGKERARLAFLDKDRMAFSREGSGKTIPLKRDSDQSSSQSQK